MSTKRVISIIFTLIVIAAVVTFSISEHGSIIALLIILVGVIAFFINTIRTWYPIAYYNLLIKLSPKCATAYSKRGMTYLNRKEYERAIKDFDRALQLKSRNVDAYDGRGWAYYKLKEYPQAFQDFDRALELDPNYVDAHDGRGFVNFRLKEYQQAIQDFDRALELDPNYIQAYVGRGMAYLGLKDIEQGLADFIKAREILPTSIFSHWMAERSGMILRGPDLGDAERWEAIAAVDLQDSIAYVCRGVALWLGGKFEEALIELEQAIVLADPNEWDAYFWVGMTCASLKRDEEAMAALKHTLELGMPPILLAPLRWLEQDRPDFYEKYAKELLDLP